MEVREENNVPPVKRVDRGSLVGYIEVLGRSGKVSARYSVRKRGLTFGRAYNNDVVIEDPYICPHHLEIIWDEENGLVARDLGTVNGLLRENEKMKVDSIKLVSGVRFRIGRTTFRFYSHDYEVPETIVDSYAMSPLKALESRLMQATIFTGALFYIFGDYWMESYKKFDTLHFTYGMIGIFSLIVVWSSFWAFTSRMLTHRWNLFIHCAIASAGIVAISLFDVVLSYMSFAFALDHFQRIVSAVGMGLLIAGIIYTHLRFVSSALPFHLASVSSAVAIAFVGMTLLLSHLEKKDFNYSPRYNVTLKAPAFKIVKSKSLGDFFESARELKSEMDGD
ncbi:MAG: FHA domain-containing protein [Deltaproteobacteria bacterium]|nr:FHA domain-containing protein [Deltaproteobacteria bacterium]